MGCAADKFLPLRTILTCFLLASMATGSPASAKGRFTVLKAPGAGSQSYQGTYPGAINNDGLIAGDFSDGQFGYHGFVRSTDGAFEILEIRNAGIGPYQGTHISSMNAEGLVAGYYYTADDAIHAFLRTKSGKIEKFDAVDSPGAATVPGGINADGVIVGVYFFSNGMDPHCFVRNNRTIQLIDVPGSIATECSTINDSGTLVGDYKISAAWRGYVRAADGTLVFFDAPGAGGRINAGTRAGDINSHGAIAGTYIDDDFVSHGFLRTLDGAIITIDVAGAGSSENQGTEATRIDDRGLIAGDYIDRTNVRHGFLRKPNGAITTFDAPHAGNIADAGTFVLDLNDKGAVVGYTSDNTRVNRGYFRK